MRPKRNKFGILDKKAMLAEAENTCRELGIELPLTTEAGLCSVGHQQMTEILRILMLDAKVIIMDEPTRGIDIGAKKLVLETLVRLNRELGMTVVIISSELQELKSVSDRIAIVSEGKLVDVLSPQASDADYGLAMSGIRPSEHLEKEGTNA